MADGGRSRAATSSIGAAALLALLGACARREPPGPELSLTHVAPLGSLAAPAASASADRALAAPDGSGAREVALSPEGGSLYEVTDENAVKVVALASPTWIYASAEENSKHLGYIEPGMVVDRAPQPVAFTRHCKGGLYRVAPAGYLCMNNEVTTDLNHPIAVALAHHGRRGEPLPYVYGRVSGQPPFLYARIPTRREQLQYEGSELDEHLAKHSNAGIVAEAGPPEPLPAWLTDGKVLPKPLNVPHRSRTGPHRGQSGARSSFAFVNIYQGPQRLFGLTTELDLIPLDRVSVAHASKIRGGPVDDLPAGLVLRHAVGRFQKDEAGKVTPEGTFDAFTALSLPRPAEGDFIATGDGSFALEKTLFLVKKRASFPGIVKDGESIKWLDVSIRDQTLTAYEGRRAVYVARVSTGAAGDADPETTTATPKGFFRIQNKHLTATMTGSQSESDYDLSDVPYVQYFQGGYALHAAFWHEEFGHPHSHGCINLAPLDAAWIFEWTLPELPRAWHGVEANGQGTLLYVH